MKILTIANAASAHTVRWTQALADRNHDVTVLSVRNRPIDGVEVIGMSEDPNPNGARLVAGYVRLPFAISRRKSDVVHAHYASTNGYAVAVARATPTVLTVWGTDVVPKPGRELRNTQRHRARVAIRHADAVTSASPYLADAVEKIVPAVETTIVPFGVDTKKFRTHGPSPARPTVLIAKNLEDKYGVEYVIRAMQIVGSEHATARLVVAGDGRRRALLERMAQDAGVEATFLGRVDHDDLPGLMADASVVVNPTIVDESFGVVLLEAQAVGRPVVTTAVGNVANVTIPGTTAVLVPPNDPTALATAVSSVLRGEALVDAASAGPSFVADHFEWNACVDKMEQLLVTVAGR